MAAQGRNLIQNLAGCTIAGDINGNTTGEDPQLVPLASNGGLTQTHALCTAAGVPGNIIGLNALGTHAIVVAAPPTANNSFSGFVYADVNHNGIKDPPELGLPNVTVTISGPVTRTVTTDAIGAYRFLNLPSGDYSVTETQPSAFQDGLDTRGTPPLGTVSNDAFLNVNLSGNVDAVEYNFGERGLIQELISKPSIKRWTSTWPKSWMRSCSLDLESPVEHLHFGPKGP